MAAPTVLVRHGIQVLNTIGTLERKVTVLCPSFIQVLQTRCKGQRVKIRQPTVDKEKGKWAPREKVVKKAVKRSTMKPEQIAEFMNRKPQDNVWIRMMYPRPSYSIEDAVNMHKELAHPTMLDNMEGLVYLDLTLDMKTKKKTKFLSGIKKTILPPHLFRLEDEKKIVAFCKNIEDQEKAKELGATFVGGTELINEIKVGTVASHEFDFVICTPEVIPDLIGIRSLLKDKFPVKNKGNIGASVEEMITLFSKGISYESKKVEDTVATVTIPCGRLELSEEQLLENVMFIIKTVCGHRDANLGPFISKGFMTCPPSVEKFLLKLDQYVPGSKVKLEQEDDEPAKLAEDSDDD